MHIIGNATIIIVICYILAGLTTKRKLKGYSLLINMLILSLLHILLLR